MTTDLKNYKQPVWETVHKSAGALGRQRKGEERPGKNKPQEQSHEYDDEERRTALRKRGERNEDSRKDKDAKSWMAGHEQVTSEGIYRSLD